MLASRRRFLKTLGTSLFALPFLGRARTAQAQLAGAQRLIVMFSPNGTIPQHWRPTGSGANFAFPAGSILEPLDEVKSKLIVVDGLDFHGTSNHEGGMSHMLTGGEGGENQGTSLDLFVASRIGTDTRFPALTLGVQTSAWGGSTQTRMSYQAGQHVAPDDDPAHAFRSVFGEAGAPGEVDQLLVKRRSVIDLLKRELDDLGRIAGTQQKRKVDIHLESLRQMEVSLSGANSSAPGECTPPPGGVFSMSSQANDNFPAAGRAQMDIMVAGLACGFSRVGTVQWSHTVSPTVPTWLGISEGHHGLSHMGDGNAQGVAQFVAAERWFAEQFLYLVQKLESLPEPQGTGSMLDNSVVLWAKEMGDSRLHVCESVPFVIAGGGNGFFTPGRYLQYAGDSHNKLLVSICRAMGLDNATFGNPMHGTGELDGLRA